MIAGPRRCGWAALALVAAVAGLASCGPEAPPSPWAPASLEPAANPFGPDDPLWAPQPHRDRPRAGALSADGRRLYVALPGLEDLPGDEVAVVDTASRAVLRRVQVGRAPVAVALHPAGRYLVVANLLSNWASVIDTTDDRVIADIPVPWYTTAVAFSADGTRAYLANRWKDSVLTWWIDAGDGFVVTDDDYRAGDLAEPMGVATAANPDQVAVGADGQIYVASIAGGAIDVLAADGEHAGRIAVHSPIGGIAVVGRWLVASHIGRGAGFPPADGVDGDQDGTPGDGTGNVMFQDLQNELEVFDTTTLASQGVYTSDTVCCRDYRDVDPDDPGRGLAIPPPETWPAERAAFLPPRDRWIVAGALPTRIAQVSATETSARLIVVMSASNQAQRFDLSLATGALTAVDRGDALFATGFAPADVVVAPGGGAAYVVDRLGESVTVLDLAAGPRPDAALRIVVGDEAGGAFPATDVELGELFNACTAPFTVDGDQSCVHCHRDGGNLDRVVAMPLQTDRAWGSRQVQAYRGAFDTRPWFLEAAMDEKNFFPVLNELDRKENFCCEELDPLIWSAYPSVTACLASPTLEGCDHVLHCEDDPPPECAQRRYGSSHVTRDAFFLDAARRILGRAQSFGDSLVLAGTRDPIALGFDGITRAIGLFLLAAPRLPPNPNQALALPAAVRGAASYHRAEVGCAACHPLPQTTITVEPDFSPAGLPVRFPPVITPTRNPAGAVADLVTEGFRATFTVGGIGATEQGPEGIHLGVPQLRGLWDRAPRFYHDGRAHTLREALLPPGHPALGDGEIGRNERDGVADSHGGTSQLDAGEVEDLIAFVMSL